VRSPDRFENLVAAP